MRLNFAYFIISYFLYAFNYSLQTISSKFYPHRDPSSCCGKFTLRFFMFLRVFVFVLLLGTFTLLGFIVYKAWMIWNSEWGIENLGEKEKSSSILILIIAYIVQSIWCAIICFFILWFSILLLVLMCYLKDPNNVTIT